MCMYRLDPGMRILSRYLFSYIKFLILVWTFYNPVLKNRRLRVGSAIVVWNNKFFAQVPLKDIHFDKIVCKNPPFFPCKGMDNYFSDPG